MSSSRIRWGAGSCHQHSLRVRVDPGARHLDGGLFDIVVVQGGAASDPALQRIPNSAISPTHTATLVARGQAVVSRQEIGDASPRRCR